MRWAVFATALTVLLFGAGEVASANKETARQAYFEGTRLYDLADFQPALEAFKKAYLNYEDSAFLFNIAQCYRQLGNKTEAVRFYKTFLRKVPQAVNRAEVERILGNLETAIEREGAEKIVSVQPSVPPAVVAPEERAEPKPDRPRASGSSELTVAHSPHPSGRVPVYRKWWLWTAVFAVVAVGVGVGLGVGLSSIEKFSPTLPDVGPARQGLLVRF
jgi:tetratricopeptide (TPR) repeat protein